jgi:hypothetical protein
MLRLRVSDSRSEVTFDNNLRSVVGKCFAFILTSFELPELWKNVGRYFTELLGFELPELWKNVGTYFTELLGFTQLRK